MKKLQQMKYVIALMLSAACFVSCERDVDENKITLTDIYADFEILGDILFTVFINAIIY